jgi:hypothetical protein
MIPAFFDESGSNPSAAERKLFQRFKTEPGTENWTVLHSLGLSRRDKKPYGEIDFVVLIHGVAADKATCLIREETQRRATDLIQLQKPLECRFLRRDSGV